jgi:hypothetical protein
MRFGVINVPYLKPVLIVLSLTGLYAGFAIFTVLGYMFVSKCAKQFKDVVAGGFGSDSMFCLFQN